MSDDRLRELERAWRTSGSLDDEVSYLRERLRAGDLERRKLELAAHLGDPAARRLLELPEPEEQPLGEWLARIAEWGHEAAARALVAVGRVGLPRSWRRNQHPDDSYEAVIDAAEAWIREPSQLHGLGVATATQAAAGAEYGDFVASRCMTLVGRGITDPEQAAASLGALPDAARERDPDELRSKAQLELIEWALGRRDAVAERPQEVGLRLGRERDIVRALAFSPDGAWAASTSRGSVLLWRGTERTRWRSLEPAARECFAACFSPDGSQLLLGQDDGVLSTWDLSTGAEVARLSGHADRVNTVSWIGQRVWSAGLDGTVREWDPETRACLRVLEGHPRDACAAVDASAGLIASTDSDGLLLLRDLSGAEVSRAEHPNSVTGVGFAAGARPVTSCYDGRLRVWERDGRLRHELAPPERENPHTSYGLAVSPDGRRAATVSMDMSLRLWDLEAGAALGHFWTLGPCFAVAWSPDARWLLTGARNGALRLWPAGSSPE